MKNKILYISILTLIILIIIAQFVSRDHVLYPLNFNKSNSTLKVENSNFAVHDIESVDKIFIADKQNHSIILTKKDGLWRVNDKFYAREDAIANILQAINKIRVKRPISRSEHDVQIKRMAVESRKVEVYQNGELIRTYYVGGGTEDQYGTYMLIEGSSVPFIMHIPGFLGFLTPRFFALEDLWRENFIFKANPKQITYISVMNSDNNKNDFILSKDENGRFSVVDYQNKIITNLDTLQVRRFLTRLKKVSYEAMITHMTDGKRDSLVSSRPFCTIVFKSGESNKQVLKTYYVRNDVHYDDNGDLLLYDPDRVYGSFNNDLDLATVQYRTLDKIRVETSFFQK